MPHTSSSCPGKLHLHYRSACAGLPRWNESQPVDPETGNYYVNAMDGIDMYLLAGPYPTHEAALNDVRPVMLCARDKQPARTAFMTWGTVRTETVERQGALNILGWWPAAS